MREMVAPPAKDSWHGPIHHPLRTKERPKKRALKAMVEQDTKKVVAHDDESEGQRNITSHRVAYPENPSKEVAPAAGLVLPRDHISLSAPVSEAGPTNRYEGEDFPAGKGRFAHGGRHDMCGPGWTHDRVIRHEEDDLSYDTDATRNGKKLYKAALRRARDIADGNTHARKQAEPWDEMIAKKMKAKLQEDEWRQCLKKRSQAKSQAAQTQLTARTDVTHTTAVSAVTSCSMATAGFHNAEADRRKYNGNGALAYGRLCLPILPEDQRADRSVVSCKIQGDEDYDSVIGMCRTDRLTRLLRVDGAKP